MGEPFVINPEPVKDTKANTDIRSVRRKQALDKFEEMMEGDFDELFDGVNEDE